MSTPTGGIRHDLEGDTHIVTGRRSSQEIRRPAKRARRRRVHPPQQHRAATGSAGRQAGLRRLIEIEAIAAVERLGAALRDQLVVEDPGRPLAAGAEVSGKARIVEDLPERVVVETDAATPAYLVLADTFDPGWSATVDGRPAPIWPAYVAFRAVYLPQGTHTVVFTYRPAGFESGAIPERLRNLARRLFSGSGLRGRRRSRPNTRS